MVPTPSTWSCNSLLVELARDTGSAHSAFVQLVHLLHDLRGDLPGSAERKTVGLLHRKRGRSPLADGPTLPLCDGSHSVNGGAGDDAITAGSGSDSIDGGAGTDTCSAGAGKNTVKNCP